MTTNDEAVVAVVKSHGDALCEHFDTVRIFCTVHDGNTETTKTFTWGAGNFYAQYGQIIEWLIKTDEQARDDAIAELEEEDDEEDE